MGRSIPLSTDVPKDGSENRDLSETVCRTVSYLVEHSKEMSCGQSQGVE